MSKGPESHSESRQLRALERWRAAELESAQAERARLEHIAQERESTRDGLEAQLAQTHAFVRETLVGVERLSPEALRQCAEFAALQRDELKLAQAAVEESRAHCATAHEKVISHFEALSVVQRLSRRRVLEENRELERAAQARLDEHALSRLAADRGRNVHSRKEE
jgi:hypothetical protein